MSFFKKYISFVVGISLCLQVMYNRAADFGYIPIPGSEVAEVGSVFGEMIKGVLRENPRMAAVLLLPIMAAPFIMKRAEISAWAEKKYGNLEEGIKLQVAQTKDNVKKVIPSPVRMTMAALAPLFGGFSQYFTYNKWHMSIAGIVATIGQVVGHPLIGAGLSGATLMKGYFDQGLAKVDGRFDNVQQQIGALDEKNTKLHEETQKKIDLASQGIDDLKKELDDATKTIMSQVKNLEKKVSQEADGVKTELSLKIDSAVGEVREGVEVMFKQVEAFGDQVIQLNEKLKDMPEQILKLTSDLNAAKQDLENINSKNDRVLEQSKQANKKIDDLSQQLREATDIFVKTKEDVDVLMGNLADQIKDFIEKTTEKLANAESDRSHLFAQVSDLNTLLLSLQLLEKQNGESIKKLESSCRVADAKSKSRHKELKVLFVAQESSMLSLGTKVSQVDEKISGFQKAFNDLLDQIRGVEIRVENVEKNQESLSSKMDNNQAELLKKLEAQERKTNELQLELMRSKANHSEELIKLRQELHNAAEDVRRDFQEIKQQNKETQSMVQQAGWSFQTSAPYPQIVGPHVPIYSNRSMFNQDSFGKQKFTYGQLELAAVFAVAMHQNRVRSLANVPW